MTLPFEKWTTWRVAILPQMYCLLFSTAQGAESLYFWKKKTQCFTAHFPANKFRHKGVKMLSLNIPHIEDMFHVHITEISTREKEGVRSCRNAQTVYHQETRPSTHWTGGCDGSISGLDAFDESLFPAWNQTLICWLLVRSLVNLPNETCLLIFPWETDENHRKLQRI
jgi:hypothetical protein